MTLGAAALFQKATDLRSSLDLVIKVKFRYCRMYIEADIFRKGKPQLPVLFCVNAIHTIF